MRGVRVMGGIHVMGGMWPLGTFGDSLSVRCRQPGVDPPAQIHPWIPRLGPLASA